MNADSEPKNSATTSQILGPEPPKSAQKTDPKPAQNTRKRVGQVACCPKEVRARINEMLDDGVSYPGIVKRLGPDGEGISPRAVMSWKQGGYQDYLRQQQIVQECRARQEISLGLLRGASPISGFQATQQIASAQICEAVAEIGPDILREALTANPLNYFRMLNSFARLATGGLKCERFIADQTDQQTDAEKPVSGTKKGMSQESVQEMRDHLKLM